MNSAQVRKAQKLIPKSTRLVTMHGNNGGAWALGVHAGDHWFLAGDEVKAEPVMIVNAGELRRLSVGDCSVIRWRGGDVLEGETAGGGQWRGILPAGAQPVRGDWRAIAEIDARDPDHDGAQVIRIARQVRASLTGGDPNKYAVGNLSWGMDDADRQYLLVIGAGAEQYAEYTAEDPLPFTTERADKYSLSVMSAPPEVVKLWADADAALFGVESGTLSFSLVMRGGLWVRGGCILSPGRIRRVIPPDHETTEALCLDAAEVKGLMKALRPALNDRKPDMRRYTTIALGVEGRYAMAWGERITARVDMNAPPSDPVWLWPFPLDGALRQVSDRGLLRFRVKHTSEDLALWTVQDEGGMRVVFTGPGSKPISEVAYLLDAPAGTLSARGGAA